MSAASGSHHASLYIVYNHHLSRSAALTDTCCQIVSQLSDGSVCRDEKDTDDIFDDADEKLAQQKDPSPPPDPLADHILPKPSPKAQVCCPAQHAFLSEECH